MKLKARSAAGARYTHGLAKFPFFYYFFPISTNRLAFFFPVEPISLGVPALIKGFVRESVDLPYNQES